MKTRLLLTLLILSLVIASACSFHPIVDPRTPADATATNEARATATAIVIEPTLEATPAPECLIKGNISSQGEKIYHVPGGASYNRTVIDPELGEQWFCSEEEAVAAGWRKALR